MAHEENQHQHGSQSQTSHLQTYRRFPSLTAADESVAGALAVSLAGNLPELGALATASFLDGFGIASLIGSIILLVAAVIVFRLMPRRFDLNQDH